MAAFVGFAARALCAFCGLPQVAAAEQRQWMRPGSNLPSGTDAIRGFRFLNWSRTFGCAPSALYYPRTRDEIVRLIKEAASRGDKVKVVGAGHSPSDIACTSGVMLDLRHHNRVLEVDKANRTVKVEAGIRISELVDRLAWLGLALSSLGSIAEQTVAGAMATGTHGTGCAFGLLSTQAVAMELVDAAGNVVSCSRHHNRDVFLAACCSLGALGVVCSVTLRCEQSFKLRSSQVACTLDALLCDDAWRRVATSADHVRFWWFPHTRNVVVWRATRCSGSAPSLEGERLPFSWFWDRFVGYHLLESLLWLASFARSCAPLLNRLYFRLLFGGSTPAKASGGRRASPLSALLTERLAGDEPLGPKERLGRGDRIFTFDCLFKQSVNEWAIPQAEFPVAMDRLRVAIDEHALNVDFPVEIRFARGDDAFLSPCHGRDTCYIGVIMYRPYGKLVEYKKYWEVYENVMFQSGGRPHWAKAHKLRASELRELYPRWSDFLDVRRHLDPALLFTNDYLAKVLGEYTTKDDGAVV